MVGMFSREERKWEKLRSHSPFLGQAINNLRISARSHFPTFCDLLRSSPSADNLSEILLLSGHYLEAFAWVSRAEGQTQGREAIVSKPVERINGWRRSGGSGRFEAF